MINLAVIGATGSVGSSVMSVCRAWRDKINVIALAANSDSQKLKNLAEEFKVKYYVSYEREGLEGLLRIANDENINHIVFASSGTAAIKSLCEALKNDKNISLANKESIVVAGKWVMPLIKRPDQLRPVDSEHNAIWECLFGEDKKFVKKIYLTASGGPFRTWTHDEMKNVTPEMALKHPVWSMGAKITIDSATLMNKGIELIEAMYLFGLEPEQVDALISPGSFVHGLIEFKDGGVKMLAASPDMRFPAASSLFYPERFYPSPDFKEPDFRNKIEFEVPDTKKFPALRIARNVMKLGGVYPALLVGADEVAVELFLNGKIKFTDIALLIEKVLEENINKNLPEPKSLDEAINYLEIARQETKNFAENL